MREKQHFEKGSWLKAAAAVASLPLPDDGVHAPDLGRALQNAEGLGEGLRLVCRGQRCPVTTATSKTAEVMRGNRRGRWKETHRITSDFFFSFFCM